MTYLSTYLNFNGYTEEVFNFYKSVFGGEFVSMVRFSDTPMADHVPEKDRGLIMHIGLKVGSSLLMGTDVLEGMVPVKAGTNTSISINVDSKAEADRIFNGLSEGGNIVMPMEDVFWGDYYGMFTDKYEIQWMVSYNPHGS